jgi:hypothetical protein
VDALPSAPRVPAAADSTSKTPRPAPDPVAV